MVSQLLALLYPTSEALAPSRWSLPNPASFAPEARRRIGAEQIPITVADPVPQAGTLNVLVLLDRPGGAEETVGAIADYLGPQLGCASLLIPIKPGARWTRVDTAIEQLEGFAEGTSFGARVAFGRRDETVALEACEGSYRLVVDLSEDSNLGRTLKMCAIAYVVGPQGVTHFAESMRRRPRLLTRPRDWGRLRDEISKAS